MADFYVKSYEEFQAAYQDPFYLDVVKKDEQYIFDIDSMLVTIGVEIDVIDNGKKVEKQGAEF
jgi:hypothetical protein